MFTEYSSARSRIYHLSHTLQLFAVSSCDYTEILASGLSLGARDLFLFRNFSSQARDLLLGARDLVRNFSLQAHDKF